MGVSILLILSFLLNFQFSSRDSKRMLQIFLCEESQMYVIGGKYNKNILNMDYSPLKIIQFFRLFVIYGK
jgi:hypothetical protein